MTIVDFKNEESLPSLRLSLFTETSSDVQRAKKIRAVSNETGLSWMCSDLVKFNEGSKKSWAGYANIVPAEGSLIPEGNWSVYYTDCAEESWEGTFTVKYNADYLQKHAGDFPDCINSSNTEKIAVYSAEGKLIYFGEKKKTWTDISKVKNDIKAAVKYRICYFISTENVMILMPEQGEKENTLPE